MAAKIKQSGHDIIVLEVGFDLPGQLREGLRSKGFPTHLVASLEEAEVLAPKLPSPILMIGLADDDKVTSNFLDQISAALVLAHYPLILLGERVEHLQETAEKAFPLTVTITWPISTAELLQALQHISRTVKSGRLVAPKIPPETPKPTPIAPPKPTILRVEPPQSLTPKKTRKVDAELEEAMMRSQMRRGLAIPEKLFAVIGELGLFTRSIGGERYPLPSSDEDLIRRANFPLKLKPTIDLISTELGAHGSRHLFRSAAMSNSVGEALKLSSHHCELARDASLLMASTLTRKDRSLLRTNFLNAESADVRMTLASRMKDSAMKVAVEMGNPEVGKVISAAARVLSGELEGSSDEMALVGAVIVATEITDRVCFQSGHWNPRAAHYLLRKCKNGDMVGIPASVIACVIKLLSEAIASRQLSMLVNKTARNDPALKAEARRVRDEPVSQNEEKIALDKLLPGMRLSRPIRTYDGRLVLAEDLILDQDLIWRLWQLSAIRPLNAPVVILAKKFSGSESENSSDADNAPSFDEQTDVVH